MELLTSCTVSVLLVACGGGGEVGETNSGTTATITSASGAFSASTSTSVPQVPVAHSSKGVLADALDPNGIDTASSILAAEEVTTILTHATDSLEVTAEASGKSVVEMVAETRPDAMVAMGDGSVTQPTVERPTRSIAVTDILASARSDTPLSTQTWDYQCYGQNKSAKAIPLVGVIGDTLVEAPRMRLGLEKPQAGAAERGIVLRTASTDPMTAGAPRCEVSFTRGANSFLPKEKDFWFASRIWIEDWASSSDEQLIMQFHAGDSSQNLGPFFALYVRGNRARAALRFDTQAAAMSTMSTRASNDIWSGPVNFARQWATVVVHARISTDAAKGPFLRFWIDGQLLGEHLGPVGYNGTGSDYAKVGYYHWLSGNTWDVNVPVRTMYLSRSMLVRDASQTYTEADLRAAVE